MRIGPYRVVLAVVLTSVGCRSDGDGPAPKPQQQLQLVETNWNFAAWCSAWGLNCQVEGVDRSTNAGRDLLRTIQALADSPSDLIVRRAELETDAFVSSVAAFGGQQLLAAIVERLDEGQVTRLRVAAGELTIDAANPVDFTGPSGLVTRTESSVSATTTADGKVRLSGISWSGPSGDAVALQEVAFQSPESLQWRGPDLQVSDVPVSFVADNVLWTPPPASGELIDLYPAIAAKLAPIAAWAVSGQRELLLDAQAFGTWAETIPAMVDDPTTKAALAYALRRITRIESTQTSRRSRYMTAATAQDIVCRLGDMAQITFERSFGIDSITPFGATGTKVMVHGIRLKPLTGAVRPNIRLGRIDLERTRIVIHNVPIVGTYEVDMTEPSSEPMSLVCPG